MLEEWWRLVAEQPVPAGDPLEAKLALARLIVARSHGEEAARGAEEHFTRVVREGQAPEDVPEHALPAGDPVHLPALLADAFGLSTSEARRLIGQGGVKLDGETSDRARRRARAALGRRSAGRQEALRSAQRSRLTGSERLATLPRLPERVAYRKSLQTTNNGASQEDSLKRKPAIPEASGVSRGLFYALPTAWSLKTQQRAFTSRGWFDPARTGGRSSSSTKPVTTLFGEWDFEHILKVMTNDPSPSGGEPFFTESLILAQDERWRRA